MASKEEEHSEMQTVVDIHTQTWIPGEFETHFSEAKIKHG